MSRAIGLTPRAAELLDLLQQHPDPLCPPSYDEICARMGWKSKGNVTRHMKLLEEKGYVRRQFGRHRSVILLEKLAQRHPLDMTVRLAPEVHFHLERMCRAERVKPEVKIKEIVRQYVGAAQ